MRIWPGPIAAALLALLAGCTITRDTLPQRSATEQLLISTAADRAAAQLTVKLKPNSKVFLDSTNFEGYDSKYAIGAITEQVLEHGARLMPERKDADVVVAIRSGALSIDETNHLVGLPEIPVPIPFAGTFTIPEMALFSKHQYQGLAKFAATAYDANTGEIIGTSGASYGFSHRTHWVVLFMISWNSDDLIPKEQKDKN